jgi:hypothetical protein
MPIDYADDWNSRENHESQRSWNEVRRIVRATPGEIGEAASSGSGETVTVVKGIHQRVVRYRRQTAHIRVSYCGESYHIPLELGRDGVWEPSGPATLLRHFLLK